MSAAGTGPDFETVYLIGGPRDNQMLSVPRDRMVATVTHPAAGAAVMHSVGSEPEQPVYEYARSPLPDGWPPVFALSSDVDQAWPVERVIAKLAQRGKAPIWQRPRG